MFYVMQDISMAGADTGGALDLSKIFLVYQSSHSNKAVTVLEQCVVSYVRIFKYFISNKCMVDGVGRYCQLAVAFFWSHLTKPDNVVPQFILIPPFHKSGSTPVLWWFSFMGRIGGEYKIFVGIPSTFLFYMPHNYLKHSHCCKRYYYLVDSVPVAE